MVVQADINLLCLLSGVDSGQGHIIAPYDGRPELDMGKSLQYGNIFHQQIRICDV